MAEIQNVRKIARIVVEAVTPLAVGTGGNSVMTDAVVAVDYNGLPYIPGTALTGVLRHALEGTIDVDDVFGFVEGEKVLGSRIIVSDAKIVDFNGKVVDGKVRPSPVLMQLYKDCPIRQHVSLNSKGVTEGTGKFDNQVVYKGTRFCFDVELMVGQTDAEECFQKILGVVRNGFRIGGGTRKGYGHLEVKSLWTKEYNTDNDYLEHSTHLSVLDESMKFWKYDTEPSDAAYKEIKITPEDFVFFGSGFGNENADASQLIEKYLVWGDDKKAEVKCGFVIPASSVKGAFAHRFIYWYNALSDSYADSQMQDAGAQAKEILFGSTDKTGLMFFDDIVESVPENRKVFNHVKIDRFTGGAFPGALYNEEAMYLKGHDFMLKYWLDEKSLEARCKDNKDMIMTAIERVIEDIQKGLLPLGGLTNRGHGCFLKVNGVRL